MLDTITAQSVNQADQDNSLFFKDLLNIYQDFRKKKLFHLEISQKSAILENIDMEYYTKQHSIKPFFVSTANRAKQYSIFWYILHF